MICTWAGNICDLLDWIRPLPIDDLIIERPDLNDLFITYYSEQAGAIDTQGGQSV